MVIVATLLGLCSSGPAAAEATAPHEGGVGTLPSQQQGGSGPGMGTGTGSGPGMGATGTGTGPEEGGRHVSAERFMSHSIKAYR